MYKTVYMSARPVPVVGTPMDPQKLARQAPLVGLMLAVATLGGCLSYWGLDDFPYESFEDAMAAGGPTVGPDGVNSTARLMLVEPAAKDAEMGLQRVIVLLYDNETREPIEGVDLGLLAGMASTGTGTATTSDLEHRNDGIYVGKTDLDSKGGWTLRFTATAGATLNFTHTVFVGPADTSDGDDTDDGNAADPGNAGQGNASDGTDNTTGNETGDGNESGEGADPDNDTATYADPVNDTFTGSETAAIGSTAHDQAKTYNITNGANVTVTITLDEPGYLTELTLRLKDADGVNIAILDVDTATTSKSWNGPALTSGDHLLEVDGEGLLFGYTVTVKTTYGA